MYKCPNGCADYQPAFEREDVCSRRQYIDPDGYSGGQGMAVIVERGPVKCGKCGARAEWIDARQVELFPIAPTLTA